MVREAQDKFVEDDGNAAIVNSTEQYDYSDKYHYDSAGYIDLGQEFAKAIFKLSNP